MRCAEIVDGVVTNVAVFEECPAGWLEDTIGASPGWILVDGVISAPALLEPEPSNEQVQAKVNAEARVYLASTDWYVIRMIETGEDIPAEILTERAAARARVE